MEENFVITMEIVPTIEIKLTDPAGHKHRVENRSIRGVYELKGQTVVVFNDSEKPDLYVRETVAEVVERVQESWRIYNKCINQNKIVPINS